MTRRTKLAFTEPEDEPEAPEPLRRVKVLPPFRVCHAGVAYTPDEVAEIPASVAEKWILHRWVSPAS